MRTGYKGWLVGGFAVIIGGLGVAWATGHGGPISFDRSSTQSRHAPSQALGGYVGSMQSGMRSTGMGTSRITATRLAALVKSGERGVAVSRATNSLTYTASPVTIVVLASPTALHRPGLQWEVDGRINPTVIVPTHATVTVTLVNADSGYMHGFEVTTAQPPFAWEAMRQGRTAFAGSFVHPLLPEYHGTFAFLSTTFIANTTGTFHYICPVPGHAHHGMSGIFRVQ